MAKNDMVDERNSGKGDSGGLAGDVTNGPNQTGSGVGAGGLNPRLRSVNGGQFRTALSDNPGSAPFIEGGNKGMGKTDQDRFGDAALYKEQSNQGGDENLESANDSNIDDYYKQLSARRTPNYDILPNLQVKQKPLALPPVEGETGFVGAQTGAVPGMSVIMGKKGFTQDQPVWGQVSSFTGYPDLSGSTDVDHDMGYPGVPHEEYDRDEFAKWKLTTSQSDNMMPQTGFTRDTNDGVPNPNVDARDSGGGNPDTQSIPSQNSGDSDTPDMPQTEFTHGVDGFGGAPDFKKATPQNQKDASNLYEPQPVQ